MGNPVLRKWGWEFHPRKPRSLGCAGQSTGEEMLHREQSLGSTDSSPTPGSPVSTDDDMCVKKLAKAWKRIAWEYQKENSLELTQNQE